MSIARLPSHSTYPLRQSYYQRRTERAGSESAIWMLADMQAVMDGRTHAPADDMSAEQYRLLIRHSILSLPVGAPPEVPIPFKDDENGGIRSEVLGSASAILKRYEASGASSIPTYEGEGVHGYGWWS